MASVKPDSASRILSVTDWLNRLDDRNNMVIIKVMELNTCNFIFSFNYCGIKLFGFKCIFVLADYQHC